jgi:hypothetical protein
MLIKPAQQKTNFLFLVRVHTSLGFFRGGAHPEFFLLVTALAP